MKRNRITYAIFIFLTICAGLLSRKLGRILPDFLNLYVGDALWAFAVFLLVGFLFPNKKISFVWMVSLVFSYAIEVSQLYHAPWLDSIRHTTPGGLVLGFGFLWSDILAYTIGITAGAIGEYCIKKYVVKK